MPDFDCKIRLGIRKNDKFPHSKPSTATSLKKVQRKTAGLFLCRYGIGESGKAVFLPPPTHPFVQSLRHSVKSFTTSGSTFTAPVRHFTKLLFVFEGLCLLWSQELITPSI